MKISKILLSVVLLIIALLGGSVGYLIGHHSNVITNKKVNKVAQTAIINAVKKTDNILPNPIAKKITINASGINIGNIIITAEITKIDGNYITATASSGDVYTFNTTKNTYVFNSQKKKSSLSILAINNVVQINSSVARDGSLTAINITVLN